MSERSGARPGGGFRAIVTGGAGFIGSHLVDRLLADGAAVLLIDDLSTGSEENIPPEAEFVRRDIAEGELDDLFRDWQPDVVFHLAAQASVPASQRDPIRDLAVNVVGTHRILAAARGAGSSRVVFVSSGGAIYGETSRPAGELRRPSPHSYYGVHKLTAEGHVALAGPDHVIVRPSNVYGPRQVVGIDGAVVAAFLDQARRGGGLTIHGDGTQTRDLVHVRDVVDALVLLGRSSAHGGTWNVGTGQSTSVNELASIVEEAVGYPIRRAFGPPRIGDIRHSSVSSARLRTLGWEPKVPLRAAIHELVRVGATGLRQAPNP